MNCPKCGRELYDQPIVDQRIACACGGIVRVSRELPVASAVVPEPEAEREPMPTIRRLKKHHQMRGPGTWFADASLVWLCIVPFFGSLFILLMFGACAFIQEALRTYPFYR